MSKNDLAQKLKMGERNFEFSEDTRRSFWSKLMNDKGQLIKGGENPATIMI